MRGTRTSPLLLLAALAAACGPPAPPPRVVVACPLGPASLVPDTANEEFTISVLSNAYESLADFDGKLALEPGLAASWYTEDDRRWIFRLREGVRFHDGKLLDAGDVVASLEQARTAPESKRRADLAPIESLQAVDSRTVLIRTRYPFGSMPHRLASVSIWRPGAQPSDPPLGTGPYRVVKWSPGGDTVLEAFAQYHGPAPAVQSLEFKVVPEVESRLEQLTQGAVHLLVDVPPEAMPRLDKLPGLRTMTEKGLRVLFLGLDCARTTLAGGGPNPLRDVRVRRALALALDRKGLVSGPLGGYAELIEQVVAPPVFGYADGLPVLARDTASARRLLAEAGYPDGIALDLDFMPKKYRAMAEVVAAVSQQLAGSGFRITPRPFEAPDFIQRLEHRDSSFFLWGWMSTGGDAGVSYEYLLHSPGSGYGIDNGGGYASPDVDRLLGEASATLDPAVRRRLLQKVAVTVSADVPVIPLYRQTDLYAMAKRLDFQPRVDRRIRGREMRWR